MPKKATSSKKTRGKAWRKNDLGLGVAKPADDRLPPHSDSFRDTWEPRRSINEPNTRRL